MSFRVFGIERKIQREDQWLEKSGFEKLGLAREVERGMMLSTIL